MTSDEPQFSPGAWRLVALRVGDSVELRAMLPGGAEGIFLWRLALDEAHALAKAIVAAATSAAGDNDP